VRGAPPGDQPITARWRGVGEPNLWYIISGRPFTPEYAGSTDPDVWATQSPSTVCSDVSTSFRMVYAGLAPGAAS